MGKLCVGLHDDCGSGDRKQTNRQESLFLLVQRHIKYFVHACLCRDANCRLLGCQKMKRIIQHAQSCKQKINGGCFICRKVIVQCNYHAKQCQEAKCLVLFCANIKISLRRQLQQRMQQACILSCIATMQNRGISGDVLQPSPGNSNSSSQSFPDVQPHTLLHPLQPGTGMNSSEPPVGALEDVQGQAATASPTMPHMIASNCDKYNPIVNDLAANAELMAPRQQIQAQMQNPMSQMMSVVPNSMPNIGNVASWENSGYVQNQQPHQNTQLLSNPQLGLCQSSQIMGESNYVHNSVGNSKTGSLQVMPNPDPSIADMHDTHIWQQFLQTLKSPEMQNRMSQMMLIVPNSMSNIGNVASWENSGYVQNQQPHQNTHPLSNPQLGLCQSSQIMGESNSVHNSVENSKVGPLQVMPNPDPSMAHMHETHAWQQFQSLESFQQQRQLFPIQKPNPQLMTAFTKHRIPMQEDQQEQRQIQEQQQQQQQQIFLNEGNMITPPPETVWYELQQQHLLTMQRQQQRANPLAHAQFSMYPQYTRMPVPTNFGHQEEFQEKSFQFQQQPQDLMQLQMKLPSSPTYSPASPQQSILGCLQDPIPSLQQIVQQVHSPPPTASQLSHAMCSPHPIAFPSTQSNTPHIQHTQFSRQQLGLSTHYSEQTLLPHSNFSFMTSRLSGSY